MSQRLRLTLTILAGAIGAIAGLMGGAALAGGLMWIFIFGDNPWPAWAWWPFMAIALLCAAILGWRFARTTWTVTKRHSPADRNRR